MRTILPLSFLRKKKRKGFTLIELLLAMAVIGILAAVVIVAANPTKQLSSAQDANRNNNIRQYQKALEQYLVERGDFPADIPDGIGAAKPICLVMETDASCVNLDALYSLYLPCIPYDNAGSNPLHAGYSVYQEAGRPHIVSHHLAQGKSESGGCAEPSAPVGHWKLDEVSIGNTVVDSSGNGFDGTHINLTAPNGPSGGGAKTKYMNPRSLLVNSAGAEMQHVKIPRDAMLRSPNAFSWSVWAKSVIPGAAYTKPGFIVDMGFMADNGYGIAVSSGGDKVNGYYNNTWVSLSTTLDTAWHHYVLTYNGSTLSLYRDGILQEDKSVSPGSINNNYDLHIGTQSKNVAGDKRDFKGNIDDVRFYDRALSPGEVMAISFGGN